MKYKLRYVKRLALEWAFRKTLKRLEEDMLWNLNNSYAECEDADFTDGMNFVTVMVLDRCVNQDENGIWSFCDA